MTNDTHSVDLTHDELEMIEAALQTQEKILSVQSRASDDKTLQTRLTALKTLMRSLPRRNKTGIAAPAQSWTQIARSLFL